MLIHNEISIYKSILAYKMGIEFIVLSFIS